MKIFDTAAFRNSKKVLDLVAKRFEMISKNIAGSDLPEYKSIDIKDFDNLLKNLDEKSSILQTTNSAHIDISATSNIKISEKMESSRLDGNSVDVDEELVKMSKATTLYNAIIVARSKLASIIKNGIENG